MLLSKKEKPILRDNEPHTPRKKFQLRTMMDGESLKNPEEGNGRSDLHMKQPHNLGGMLCGENTGGKKVEKPVQRPIQSILAGEKRGAERRDVREEI